MQTVNEYVTPKPMSASDFYGKLVLILVMFIGVLMAGLLVVVKFAVGASIGNALLGLGVFMAIVFGVMYFVMESDRVKKLNIV